MVKHEEMGGKTTGTVNFEKAMGTVGAIKVGAIVVAGSEPGSGSDTNAEPRGPRKHRSWMRPDSWPRTSGRPSTGFH
jgi:hypothetical protein